MVSNASEDFPEPDSPVITVSLSRGIETSMFLRLCSRAPRMNNASSAIAWVSWARGWGETSCAVRARFRRFEQGDRQGGSEWEGAPVKWDHVSRPAMPISPVLPFLFSPFPLPTHFPVPLPLLP